MLRIGYVVAPGFQVMALAGLSVFEMANADGSGPHYDVRLLSECGGLVPSSFGAVVETQTFGRATFDTVIVGGSQEVRPASRKTIMFIRRALKSSRRVASVCTGAFVLADAGVLEKRRVTTHWAHARDLQMRHPTVKVDEDCMFIIDGPIWTSAGMTAGIDLALGMVERDLGCFDTAWSGWHLRDGFLISPEGWQVGSGEVLAIRILRQQLACYEVELKRLQGEALSIQEQPLPDVWPEWVFEKMA